MIKFRKELIETIISSGTEVHVALPVSDEDSWIVNELEELGAAVHTVTMGRTGMNPVGDLRTLFELWRLMTRIRPTHVLAYTIKPIVYGSLAARFAGVPNRFALVTGRGYAFENDRGRFHVGGLAQRMYKVALAHVKTVMFQNSDDESLFIDRNLIFAE